MQIIYAFKSDIIRTATSDTVIIDDLVLMFLSKSKIRHFQALYILDFQIAV
jgi:hypothetical protein